MAKKKSSELRSFRVVFCESPQFRAIMGDIAMSQDAGSLMFGWSKAGFSVIKFNCLGLDALAVKSVCDIDDVADFLATSGGAE